MSELPVLALDVGGTKIAAALVDGGRVLRHVQRPTGDPWATVVAVLDEARDGRPVRGVGIGCGGPLDPVAGTVSPINLPAWDGFPLRERVAALLPGVPVELAGDAVCTALGEARHGAGRGTADLLGVVVSTGVGGGLIASGRPVPGRTGNAGHVGHMVVAADGAGCPCGGRGCLETVASGPSLVRWARSQGWDGTDAADLAAAGGPVARAAFRRGGLALGRALVSAAAVCDVDLVVVGGGVSRAGALLFDPVREAVAAHAGLSFLRTLRVVPAGPWAGLVGAAELVDR
ncbi:MAG: ROK family protein [Pseudonocardiaceae bacterium]